MKIHHIIYLILTISAFTACKKKENTEFTDSPIIESYLSPGDYLNIRVSRQIPFSSDVTYSQDNIDSLSVLVSVGNDTYFLKTAGDGKYIDSSLVVKAGETYNLSFIYNSKNVSAYTNIPSKPVKFTESAAIIYAYRMDSTSSFDPGGMSSMPTPVTLDWYNSDDSYYIVVIENLETTLDPIRDFGTDESTGNVFRKPPTTASGLELRPQEFKYFGRHRLILYHVLPDYASLYTSTTSSSLDLTNPSTSITNGYGIFTGLNSDTLYLDVKEKK